MKKIIIVRIREMVMGGISKTAVDLLKNLDNKKYKIVFFIRFPKQEKWDFLLKILKKKLNNFYL